MDTTGTIRPGQRVLCSHPPLAHLGVGTVTHTGTRHIVVWFDDYHAHMVFDRPPAVATTTTAAAGAP